MSHFMAAERDGKRLAKRKSSISSMNSWSITRWVSGLLLEHVDRDFATAILQAFDPKRGSPFIGVEVRHLGEATRRDVPGGSAVAGRSAGFLIGYIGLDPTKFETVLPRESDRIVEQLARWRSSESNINFMGPHLTAAQYANAWAPATVARIRELEHRYDPTGMFKPPG